MNDLIGASGYVVSGLVLVLTFLASVLPMNREGGGLSPTGKTVTTCLLLLGLAGLTVTYLSERTAEKDRSDAEERLQRFIRDETDRPSPAQYSVEVSIVKPMGDGLVYHTPETGIPIKISDVMLAVGCNDGQEGWTLRPQVRTQSIEFDPSSRYARGSFNSPMFSTNTIVFSGFRGTIPEALPTEALRSTSVYVGQSLTGWDGPRLTDEIHDLEGLRMRGASGKIYKLGPDAVTFIRERSTSSNYYDYWILGAPVEVTITIRGSVVRSDAYFPTCDCALPPFGRTSLCGGTGWIVEDDSSPEPNVEWPEDFALPEAGITSSTAASTTQPS